MLWSSNENTSSKSKIKKEDVKIMDVGLYWFKCNRCGKEFMAYLKGKYEWQDNGDLNFIVEDSDKIYIVYRADLKDQYKGSRIYPIMDMGYECRQCRKGVSLLSYPI